MYTCIAADNLGKNSRCAIFNGDGPCIKWRNGLVVKIRLNNGPPEWKIWNQCDLKNDGKYLDKNQ